MLPFTDLKRQRRRGGQNRAPTNIVRLVAVMFTVWAKKIA
ncbi:hypothetical protein ACVMB2_003969 [Sinorhizobium meliloti]